MIRLSVVLLWLGFISVMLILEELLWRLHLIRGEMARKFMHVLIGCSAALWPFILSWEEIGLIFMVAVSAVSTLHATRIFHSIYDIRRRSYGDFGAPIALGLIAFAQPSVVLFVTCTLHVALADGLAAVFGSRYGCTNKYTILGQRKSVIGTMGFWFLSTTIFVVAALVTNNLILCLLAPLLAVGAAVFENISPFGLDNITIPAFVFVAITLLQ